MKNLSIIGVLLALGAAFLWGTAGTAQSFTDGTLSPFWIGALRLVLACTFFHSLFFYVNAHNRKPNLKEASSLSGDLRKNYWLCITIAGVCMGLYNLTFFAGVKATGIAVGTATTIGSAPIWAGILQAISMRKPPSKVWWMGTLCATFGGFWMVLSQSSSWHIDVVGLMICLTAGFCYALYSLMSKKLVNIASPLTITKQTFTISLFIALPVALLIGGKPNITLPNALVIIYLGLFTTGVAYLLYTKALKHISAPTGVALALIEPIVAFVLAIVVAKELVSEWAFFGLIFILAGLWLVLRSEGKQKA